MGISVSVIVLVLLLVAVVVVVVSLLVYGYKHPNSSLGLFMIEVSAKSNYSSFKDAFKGLFNETASISADYNFFDVI